MPKRVLAATLLMLMMAASPSVTGHGDDADVVFEWNGILQASLALPPPAGVPPAGTSGIPLLRDDARRHVRCREFNRRTVSTLLRAGALVARRLG